MKKNKQITAKIIYTFVLFFFVFSSIKNIEASSLTNKLNWDNPNKNGTNPYKISTDAILNPQTMMAVVGCTGIVDKVSTATTGFLKDSLAKILKKESGKLSTQELYEKYCSQGKAIANTSVSGMPTVLGNGVNSSAIQTAIKDTAFCNSNLNTKDREALLKQQETNEILTATKKREECFNGLAYTLAKNQLTSMTRQTINWVNTGFSGNPLYVQNITSLTNSIGKNVLENGIEVLANGAFPYSDTFSKTAIVNYQNRNVFDNTSNFLNSLASDLSNFITDTTSYSDSEILTEKQRAQRANNTFSNDFSTGGWDAWNAMTQRDQNNPLGFTMKASQYLADRIEQQSTETKNELIQNNGFLSQKECTMWQNYGNDGKPITTNKNLFNPTNVGSITTTAVKEFSYTTNKQNNNDKCVKWKVTTPGSMVKDKLSTYINSPERQLEIADSINEVLNNLFTKLIENFRSEGLFGLSQPSSFDSNSNYGAGGYGSNNINYESGIEYDETTDSSGYSYDSNFDLTRDLGNTYIRENTRSLGKWDAKNNRIWDPQTKTWTGGELNVDLGVWNEVSKGYEPANYYYTVEIAGNTKLFNNGYNGWAVGDRAFWDGEKWQNWKKDQASPIKTRGIIQIQSDYIVAAKEILKVLPKLMPKKGELDYCIPGPNPSYNENSRVTASLFTDYFGTLGGSYIPGKFFKRDATEIQIAQKGSQPYDDYKANLTLGGSDVLFNKITPSGDIDPEKGKSDPLYSSKVTAMKNSNSIWQNIQIFLGSYKSDEKEDLIMENISKLQVDIQKGIQGFLSNYQTKVFENLYTKKMRPEFIENESTGSLTENTNYLSVLDEAYSFTNKMFTDDESITDATLEYKDSIAQAQSNISRLNLIKSEVSKIIKTAQDRRDANLIEILKREAEKENRPISLTKEEYKRIYKDCLEEENILYLDENDIVKNSDTEKERCTDGIDNDLDGLVDKKDTDCK